jgi:hypothetical protein
MKAYEGVEIYIQLVLILTLDDGEWPASRSGSFTPGESPQYRLPWRLWGSQSRSGSDGEEKKIPALPQPKIETRSSSP